MSDEITIHNTKYGTFKQRKDELYLWIFKGYWGRPNRNDPNCFVGGTFETTVTDELISACGGFEKAAKFLCEEASR